MGVGGQYCVLRQEVRGAPSKSRNTEGLREGSSEEDHHGLFSPTLERIKDVMMTAGMCRGEHTGRPRGGAVVMELGLFAAKA